MARFLPGLELSAGFYEEVVGPLVAPWPHAAARLGKGSEVLGFDSERSTDHGWGPRLVILVEEGHLGEVRGAVDAGLPEAFRGWPTAFGWDDVPVSHHVTVATIGDWLEDQLGFDPTGGLSPLDWLVLPQQKLLEVTRGAVFRDDTGQLGRVRDALAWYPDQVWVWLLGCQWRRIAQEEAFVGRAAEAGDELGSRLVAARQARELMRLWFLMSRTYWPYTKWFGSAFARLPDGAPLGQALSEALAATDHIRREDALVVAYGLVARRHNQLQITDPVDPQTRKFYGRPYRVLMADRFAEACMARVSDPELQRLPPVGSVDQMADSTDVLDYPERLRELIRLPGRPLDRPRPDYGVNRSAR